MSIDVVRDGHIAVITINRPAARNALDPEHNEALGRAVADFEADGELRAAVLTGAGQDAFSAGADLRTLLPAYRTKILAGESLPWNFGGFTTVPRTKPLIAALNGYALAGGCEMALACDIRFASQNAMIGLAETKWAIIPGSGGTVRLPRTVPPGIAMEMILSGEPIDADEAYRTGLVNKVLPQKDLLKHAISLAHTIASRGPLAVRAARASVIDGLGADEETALEREFDRFIEVVRSEDAEEGHLAFAEKREPRYHGS